ncbi:hypothetical protein JS530_03000 [Bifidobacterium sp. LC6]|uniref:Peptide ABC transporter permease n=1 Tax=Bifidobacterium colobi TaxID=2809026 RepID=A0ABS5UUJ4_9BIFI|nr:hypothetical protein [Bifidobacterium colobi]MBT1174485.1 hypothetical protein [Bifidobacterium colobi]
MALQRNNSGVNGVRSGRRAGSGASRPTASGRSGQAMSGGRGVRQTAPKQRKRKLSKKKRAMYRRRRIVVGVILALLIALIVFCGYSIARGVGAINVAIHHDDYYALSRESVPTPKKTSNVKNCSSNDVTLELSAKTQSVPVGGSLEFTASIVHDGSGSCLVDGSDGNRVLTITSGSETMYKSDVCAADSRMLLMAKGDKDAQKMTWNTDYNATLTECTDESSWAKVNPGTYTAQIALKDEPKVKSEPLTFTVE